MPRFEERRKETFVLYSRDTNVYARNEGNYLHAIPRRNRDSPVRRSDLSAHLAKSSIIVIARRTCACIEACEKEETYSRSVYRETDERKVRQIIRF